MQKLKHIVEHNPLFKCNVFEMPLDSLISAGSVAKCCYGNKTFSSPNQLKQEVGFLK